MFDVDGGYVVGLVGVGDGDLIVVNGEVVDFGGCLVCVDFGGIYEE